MKSVNVPRNTLNLINSYVVFDCFPFHAAFIAHQPGAGLGSVYVSVNVCTSTAVNILAADFIADVFRSLSASVEQLEKTLVMLYRYLFSRHTLHGI